MKRGGYLERKSALRRKRPMRKALPRRVTRPGPGSDPAYLEAVRKLPCRIQAQREAAGFTTYGTCAFPSQAHHAGPKKNDSTAVPLCWGHHDQWHSGNGIFKGWTKADRRAWADAAIDDTRRLVAESRPTPEERSEPHGIAKEEG